MLNTANMHMFMKHSIIIISIENLTETDLYKAFHAQTLLAIAVVSANWALSCESLL